MQRLLPFALALALAAPAMTKTTPARPVTGPALTGDWGAFQIRVNLASTGGVIAMDCADATIDGPVHLDANGSFTATGRMTLLSPGPQRNADAPPASVPARFSGKVDGQTMQLTIHRQPGPDSNHILKAGRQVKIIRCL